MLESSCYIVGTGLSGFLLTPIDFEINVFVSLTVTERRRPYE